MRCQASGMPAPGWCSSSCNDGLRVECVRLDLPAGDVAGDLEDCVVDGDTPALDAVAVADRHRTGLHVTLTGDEHERHLLLLRVQNLLLHPVVGVVDLDPHTFGLQAFGEAVQVVDVVGPDGDAHHLYRREPRGEGTGVVLGQDAEEPFDRPELRRVDHHRRVPLTVGTLVFEPEPGRL